MNPGKFKNVFQVEILSENEETGTRKKSFKRVKKIFEINLYLFTY